MKETLGRKIYRDYGVYIILVVLVAFLSIFADGFWSVPNLTNILRSVSIYALLGVGMTFVMLSGRIDLSVGSVVALVGCVSALCIQSGMNFIAASIIGIAIGIICGFINGLCIAQFRVPFFIMTAGMMYAASGIALVITHETSIGIYNQDFYWWGATTVSFVPSQFIVAIIFFLICLYLLKNTKMGRYTYAIGSNAKTARLSGVNVKLYTIIIFTINGLAAGVAGVVLASRLKMGSPTSGDGYEIEAIAAAAIGGTSMTGGEGSVAKTMIGAFILCVIETGLNILGVSSSTQKIVIGAILVIVVALDMLGMKDES